MTEVARRYLDAVGACLDLGPESAHEVMAELENHLIEEAAHSPGDPQDVAEQRVISRLGSPRSLAARLNRGPRALKAGDPIIRLWLSFDTFRRWRKAMAAIAAYVPWAIVILSGPALLRPGWPLMIFGVGQLAFYFAARWLSLWVFDHLTRDEVERVATAVFWVGVAGYLVDVVIAISWWDLDKRLLLLWIGGVLLITTLTAVQLAKAKQLRPKPWIGVESGPPRTRTI
jgi:HAAS